MKRATRASKSAKAKAAFGAEDEDEDEGATARKRAKIVPLQYNDEQLRAAGLDPAVERKRKEQEISAAIPADRAELFAFPMAWEHVDDDLVKTRFRPWAGKRVAEAFGTEDPTLVDFLCDKVKKHAPARCVVGEGRGAGRGARGGSRRANLCVCVSTVGGGHPPCAHDTTFLPSLPWRAQCAH